MALTVKKGSQGFNVTFDGATAFNLATDTDVGTPSLLADGITVKSIQFVPSALDDILIVREEGATGRIIMKVKAASEYDQKIKYFFDKADRRQKLFVVGAEGSNGAMMIVET